MNLRMIGIGAGVLIILSVPLAGALAGPTAGFRPDGGGLLSSLGLRESGAVEPDGKHGPESPRNAVGRADDGAGTADGAATGTAGGAGQDAAGPRQSPPRTDARCGPELSSPEGVEAQTCVLTGEGRVRARSYYRNTTGRPLVAVLSLMGPAGRTVQIHCAVAAGDEPGVCETPKEPTEAASEAWTAVAEYAVPDEEGPLLLHAGSNSGDSVEH